MSIPELDELGARLEAGLARRAKRRRPLLLVLVALGLVAVPALAATKQMWTPLLERELEGTTRVEDPGAGPPWIVRGDVRTVGARAGQTCVSAHQVAAERKDGLRAGHEFVVPICGDLRRHDVVANALRFGPRKERSGIGPSPNAPRRVIVFGAVSDAVERVELRPGVGSARELKLSEHGRAFLAVLDGTVDPDAVVLRLGYRDGRTRDVRSPHRLNVAPLNARQSRLLAPMTATWDRRRNAVVIQTRLSARPKRMTITFLGRTLPMRRQGATDVYRAEYDATHGKYRGQLRTGGRFNVTYVLCSPNCFVARHVEVRLR